MSRADWLSVFRVVVTPVIALYLLRGNPLGAAVSFALAALTDGLDGYLARRRAPTAFGPWLDLVADKVLILVTLALLARLRVLAAWVPLLIGGRELVVAGLRIALYRRGLLLPADRWGKVKMATLCLGIGGLLFAQIPFTPFLLHRSAYGLLLLGTILTLLSGTNYGLKAWRLLRGRVGRPDKTGP